MGAGEYGFLWQEGILVMQNAEPGGTENMGCVHAAKVAATVHIRSVSAKWGTTNLRALCWA